MSNEPILKVIKFKIKWGKKCCKSQLKFTNKYIFGNYALHFRAVSEKKFQYDRTLTLMQSNRFSCKQSCMYSQNLNKTLLKCIMDFYMPCKWKCAIIGYTKTYSYTCTHTQKIPMSVLSHSSPLCPRWI